MKMNEDKIRELFFDAGLNYDEINYINGGMIATLEVRGDWKHSHLYCDYLMSKHLGYKFVTEKVTESDGSDWYTAIRIYMKMNK